MSTMSDTLAPRRRWFNFGRRMTLARWLIVLVGILLPYAARIPGIYSHGLSWLTSYVGGWQAVVFFGSFNAICWVSILIATIPYRDVRSVWFPSLLGFGALAVGHAVIDLSADAQAAIGLIFIPIYSLPFVFVGGLIGLAFDRCVFRETAAEAARTDDKFSLRTLFIITTLVAIALGLLAGFRQYRRGVMRESMRQSVLDGQLDPEKARPILGEEVDALKLEIEQRKQQRPR